MRRIPKFQPVCVNCVLDPDSEEAKRYQARYVRRKLRPLLKNIVGNIWICPRCGAQHFNSNFYPIRKHKKP